MTAVTASSTRSFADSFADSAESSAGDEASTKTSPAEASPPEPSAASAADDELRCTLCGMSACWRA